MKKFFLWLLNLYVLIGAHVLFALAICGPIHLVCLMHDFKYLWWYLLSPVIYILLTID